MRAAASVFLVCLTAGLAMAQNPKPPTPLMVPDGLRENLPLTDSVVLSVEGTNLTVFVDSTSNPDDQNKITTLEVKWTGEGGFNKAICDVGVIFGGDFDVCRADKIAKVRTRGVGPIWTAGDLIPDGWDAQRIIDEGGWLVDGSYLTGGTLDKFVPESPWIAAIIPEPSSLALLALGFVALIGVRRRR
jgi:hypothetical protein